MDLERLKLARRTVVGMKQTQKAVENGKVVHVFIARDADERVTRGVLEMCLQKGIPVTMVETMAELGKASCIKVQAAMAAMLTED